MKKIFFFFLTALLASCCCGKEPAVSSRKQITLFYSGRIGSLLQGLPGMGQTRFALQKKSPQEIRSLLKKKSIRMVLTTELPHDLPEGYKARRFAAWGTLLAVNRENPLRTITLEQAKNLLQGNSGNWKHFGGPSLRIHFYFNTSMKLFPAGKIVHRRTRKEEETFVSPQTIEEYRAFRAKLEEKKKPQQDRAKNRTFLKLPTVSDAKTFSLLFTDRWGIGAFSLKYFDENRVVLLSIDHIPPTLDNFRSGSYPLLETTYLITAETLTPAEERLQRYLESRSFGRKLYTEGFLAFPPEKR